MVGNNRGFTLIELLVAAVILAVALTPLLGLFVQGRAVATAGWDEVTAVSLARGKMEALKCAPFESLTGEPPTRFPAPYDRFRMATAVEHLEPGLAEITVTVAADATGDELCVLRARRACRWSE